MISLVHASIIVGIVGVLFAFQKQFYDSEPSNALSTNFTLLGTHPQAAAQPTATGKTIRTLKAYNG